VKRIKRHKPLFHQPVECPIDAPKPLQVIPRLHHQVEVAHVNADQLTIGLAKNQLQARLTELNDKVFSFQTALRRALGEYDFATAGQYFDSCKAALQIHQAAAGLVQDLEHDGDRRPVFVIGSLLLHDAFRRLTAVQNETIIYASGYRYGHFRTVENLVPLPLERSEYAYAKGDPAATGEALIEMEKFGASLTAHLHMHPMRGTHGNIPSGVDHAQQDRLESGGHQAVGIIFTRDGYVRFYGRQLEYDVTITGKGVERVDSNLYRLLEV